TYIGNEGQKGQQQEELFIQIGPQVKIQGRYPMGRPDQYRKVQELVEDEHPPVIMGSGQVYFGQIDQEMGQHNKGHDAQMVELQEQQEYEGVDSQMEVKVAGSYLFLVFVLHPAGRL